MSNYQIIRTIKHDGILSPLFLSYNYFNIMGNNLNVDLSHKNWMTLPYLEVYPQTHSTYAYQNNYDSSIDDVFTNNSATKGPFEFSEIPESDFGFALIEVSQLEYGAEFFKLQNVKFKFIKTINEPALNYYVTYKINQDLFDNYSCPNADLISKDFATRKFSQEEFDLILWPILAKNYIQAKTNAKIPKLNLYYSSLNLNMIISLLNSPFYDRLHLKYQIKSSTTELGSPTIENSTIFIDIQKQNIHLDTNLFIKLFYALSENKDQDFLEYSPVSQSLISLIDFSESENLNQFGNLDYNTKFLFLNYLSRIAKNPLSQFYDDTAIMHLQALKPYVLKFIHNHMSTFDSNNAKFKNDIKTYEALLNQEQNGQKPDNLYEVTPSPHDSIMPNLPNTTPDIDSIDHPKDYNDDYDEPDQF